MGVSQIYRGNPEAKEAYLTAGFTGGMNITVADDLIASNTLRQLVNFDCDVRGELSARKGYGKNNALTELLFPAGVYRNAAMTPSAETGATKEVFFTLLTNTNNVWHDLAESESIADYLETHPSTNVIRYLRLRTGVVSKNLAWEDITLTVANPVGVTIQTGTITSAEFSSDAFLTNWEAIDKYGKIYFTNNNKGLLIFDSASATPADPWTYVGAFAGKTNSAYKPNGIEARKVGFNVLGTTPLSWLDTQTILTESIQGVFITTTDRKPLQVIPSGTAFQINIMCTGTVNDFTIELNENGDPLEIKSSLNTTYSTSGVRVYDIELVTQPSAEVELVVTYTDTEILIEPYYDYYFTGQVPADAKAITQLNVGDYKMVEMYDRVVYYKGNVLWFSEVARYDYIPNYNFIILPIDSTDEITRVIFYRTSYIIFTKRRIYKISGDFESTDLTLDLVNANIGCIAPRTPMVVSNLMLFVSTQGLRALKTDTFRENLENIVEFDEPVNPLIQCNDFSEAIYYKDQYFLLLNNFGLEGRVSVNYRLFDVPNVLRYYYKQGAFVSDSYGDHPDFLFMENGRLYTLRSSAVYRYGDGYKDFLTPYNCVLETSGLNFNYPVHEKKVKSVVLKAGGGSADQAIMMQLAADGKVVSSSNMIPVDETEDGVVYEAENLELPKSLMDFSIFGPGVYNYHTKKMRLSARGKNIAMRLVSNSSDRLTIQTISYIYKLGKVKE